MTTTLAAWLHTIDPYAIELWEGGPIRWYGLSYLAGFFVAYLLIKRVAKAGISTLDPAKAGDFVITIAIAGVIGGRLGYALFYQRSLFHFTDTFPYWGVLDMMGGGMASHGGMIGAIVGTWWFARRNKQPWAFTLDLLAFGAPLGLCFGRIANFVNGELIGRECSPDYRLAVQFPQELWDHPTLYEKFATAYGREVPANFLELIQSGNAGLAQAAKAVLPTRHPSQLYAAGLEGVLVFAVLALVWMKPRRAGTVGGVFCITYGLARIFDELFRMPDAGIGYQWLHMTRGQWLSVPLVVAGIVIVVGVMLNQNRVMGGWRKVDQSEEASGDGTSRLSDQSESC